MQYLDNDMDELFNKAGNDYPLRTDVPDFDGILAKVNPAADAAPKQNYRKYLLLLLLLPLGYLLVNNNAKKIKKGKSDTANANLERSGTANTNFEKSDTANINSSQHIFLKPNVDSFYPHSVKTQPYSHPVKTEPYRHPVKTRSVLYGIPKSLEIPYLASLVRDDGKTSQSPKSARIVNTHQSPNIHFSINYTYPKPLISFPALPIDSSTFQPIKKSKQKSSVYIGVIAGPDVSTVKYQSIKNLGFSIGIVGGYKFSKHWSVETGLIYNSKKYYTDGKYFDKTKSGIPSSIYVESLDGSCNMFEVPVSVRYDFSTSKNKLFATLGATSYFMKKEKYTYDAYASGSYYEGHRSYDNSGNHLFSNMQFSIGYSRQLSNRINLRIEPYIKVPLRDIGIGNLPITSSGIYFSIMQTIR